MRARPAVPDDAEDIAHIYNEGIEDRLATYETEPRSAGDVAAWFDGETPVVVIDDGEGSVVAWASAPEYRPRRAYSGVREFSIYVACSARGGGFGRACLQALIDECEARGLWKLVSRIFLRTRAVSPSAAHSGFSRSASTAGMRSWTASGAMS